MIVNGPGRVFQRVRIYGAAFPDTPKLWEHYMGRVNVNRTCGALFKEVFEEHYVVEAHVCRNGIPEVRLMEGDNLLTVLRTLEMYGEVEIWAKDRAD